MTHLWDGLRAAYRVLGFELVTKGDNVFRDLVLARIIEPTSKIDAERVLREVGAEPASYATVKRRLPVYATPAWRQSLATASAQHARLGPASLVPFDVSTLYFETDAGDGFREPGFSKERRLEPQITLGLLTTRPDSRSRWRPSRATKPRPPPCCRSSTPSKPPTTYPMSPLLLMPG
jgi:hypothetical protein